MEKKIGFIGCGNMGTAMIQEFWNPENALRRR